MELEQRVALLEQEINVLKNEIQATLLDIEEQILTGAYPALRAADLASTGDPDQVSASRNVALDSRIDATAKNEQPPLPYASVRQIALNREVLEPRMPVEARETVRKEPERPALSTQVTSDPPNGNGHPVRARVPDISVDIQPPQLVNESDWMTFVQLTEWIGSTLEKLGTQRTYELIDVYAASGLLSRDQVEVMQQITALYSREDTGPEERDWIHHTAEQLATKPGAIEQGPVDASEDEFWRQTGSASAQRQQKRALIWRIIKGIKGFSPDQEEYRG